MGNEARKKPSGGKTDSSATISGLESRETSGMRRSTRSQTNLSPASSVRKSQRLEKRGPEIETTSSLRRSGRENKFQSPSSGKGSPAANKGGLGLKNKGGSGLKPPGVSRKDKIVNEVVEEKQESSPKVGEKRKKRLHVRQFKELFKLHNASAQDSRSKKRRLENSYGNTDSGIGGDPSDQISVSYGKGIDNDHLKSEEGLQVKGDEHGDNGLDHHNKDLEEICNEDASGNSKELEEEPLECSDGAKMEEDCLANSDGSAGEYLDPKKDCSVEKSCEWEDGEDQLISGPETLAKKNCVNNVVGEEDDGVAEKLPNQETPSGSERTIYDDEGTHNNMKSIPSESPAFKMRSLTEDVSKCSENSRSAHDSSNHEPGRLSNFMSSTNLVSVPKDRGECFDASEDEGQKTNRSDRPVDADQDSCVKCNRAGKLMHCSGKACRRSYHPSCLWTTEEDAHVPNWYCSECMNKRLTLGVHSVSEGIESILDVREMGLANSKGSVEEKEYFVKYKGLAHIHNCWIAETQLIREAPELLLNLSEQEKSWKLEWAVPHRLLLRRSITVDDQDAHFVSKGHHEWLVKWRGLDYDQVTWELEDSELFKMPEAQQLLKEYEIRHNGARSSFQQLLKEYETRHNEASNSNMSGDNKIQEKKKNLHVKHGRFSDSLRLEIVNKIREFNQKRHNVMLLEEEDRVMKVIYFISSILSSVVRPFLIVTPRESLAFWEAEFLRFTSSINVVVYGGNVDSRKIIRSLEFYQEGGELMLQVLLSSVEDISEDLEEIKGMQWEAVIVDDCQKHSILENFFCIKTFVTNWKLLLFNTRLKDTISEYRNILSLLEPVSISSQYHELIDASNKDLNALKEKVCSFIMSPRFQEYWVPVEISNVQLEQYCYFLLSNSSVLRSCSKSDPIGSLNDIFVSTQKCCDHPYLVNPLLRLLLLPEEPPQNAALDMGVKASGKLMLLDELLSEFRNQGLKVVILFQPISGSGKDNLEIILDDFLTWRFGEDSYEHIAGGGQPSTKKAALNKFNKEKDRSFLLLETRACVPSIKLSSVDSVIILNSDWNPLNDLRALHKIIIDSKLKPINVFRFYCTCTAEEKALIIAKNDTILESTQQISPSTKRMLLMWGSSYLFSRLHEFHRDKNLDYRDAVAFGYSFVTDVCREIVSIVQNHGNNNSSRYVALARQDGRCYFTDIPLLGEQRTQLEEGVSSHTYWLKLLEGKKPEWLYHSGSSERKKRVHYSDELSSPRNVQVGEPAKKRKDCSPRRAKQNPEKTKDKNKEHNGHPDVRTVQKEDRNYLLDQRGLFDMLKPAVLRICEALTLKDEAKRLAERFLEFVLHNHQVTREPETILQAFQISVCWTAAEVLEKNLEHKRLLEIATDKMKFRCQELEINSVYTKMKMLMKIFLRQNLNILNPTIDHPPVTDGSTGVLNDNCITTSIGSMDEITAAGLDESSLNENDSLEDADKLKKKCENKMKRLKEKQNSELVDFENLWEKKRAELEDTYKLESAFVRYSHANSTARADKLKILDNDYANKRKYLEGQVSNLRKELEATQQEERNAEQKKIAQLLKLVKPMGPHELLQKPSPVGSLQLQTIEDIGLCKDSIGFLSAENLPLEHNSNEAYGTHTAVMLPCSIENSRDEPYNLTEKQRAALNSAQSLENESGFQGAGASYVAGETSAECIPSCRRDCVADQHCGTGGEMTEITDQMNDIIVDKQASPERDGGNDASTIFNSLSTEQLQSPEYTLMEPQIADGTSREGFGNKQCQQRVEDVDERVGPSADTCDTSPGGETPILDPANIVPSNLARDKGARFVSAAELSIPVSVGFDQIRVASSSQHYNQPEDVQAAIQNSCTQIQQETSQLGAAHNIDANIGQDLQYVSGARGASTAYASHSNPVAAVIPTISRASSSYPSDPLQNEYDRIRKDIGVIINSHEEAKLRLRCECDKEIEEIVAHIRMKYDVKLEEAESSFSRKKNELESNLNMVMMNKFLADALRSKCMDYKAAPQGGTQKGVPSDTLRQSQPTIRPFSAAASSVVPTTSIPSRTIPPVRAVNPFPLLSSRSTLNSHENRAAASQLQHISAPFAMSSQQTPHGQSRQALTLSLSAEELLMDIARQNDAILQQLSDNLPLAPDNLQSHESCDLSQFGGQVGQRNRQPQRAGDVVCLSDDD
ncbi:hypothetical protein vseg_017748 [Gypsophila vaccaria]